MRLYPRELYGDLHHQVERFGTFQVLKWAKTQTSALSFSSIMVVMTTFPPPTEGLHHVQDKTEAFIHDKSCGVGTLYIAADRLSWSDPESGKGFSLEYPSISLHAICRDTSQFPHECIYCMMDSPLDDGGNDSDSDDSDGKVGEVRFVPEDKSALDVMFKALSECQVLHPDPENEEGEEDEDFFCDAEEGELSEEGQATLERLEGIIQMPSQEEFVQMTSTQNGHYLNGHNNVPADDEMQPNTGNDEQFEDAEK